MKFELITIGEVKCLKLGVDVTIGEGVRLGQEVQVFGQRFVITGLEQELADGLQEEIWFLTLSLK